MPLDTQLGRWTQYSAHVRDTLDQILPGMLDDDSRVLPSTLSGLRTVLGEYFHPSEADIPTDGSALSEAVTPLLTVWHEFRDRTTPPASHAELRTVLTRIRDTAHTAHLTLTTGDQLATQTIDEIIDDFATEYRTSLLLALTANYALSQTVNRWQESKASGRSVGDHLDLGTMNFVDQPGNGTVAMSALAAASTPAPVVFTPQTLAAAARELRSGGTTPPIGIMAYTQWFTTINAAWEDVYRPRLATAHGTDDDGVPWTKNDIRSEFLNEIRLIRNDIAHKRGICIDSAKNTLIAWLEPGKPIAPTTRQMMDLFDKFPRDELRRAPSRVTRSTTDTLPYVFPKEWIDKVRTHIETIEPARKRRADVLRKLIDDWMNDTTKTETST
ncbi:hypothetical protein LRS71_24445 [Rhodococcus pyridinivorans]|uniref:hypothetical protein n=1 Tax=Rhodococcus pyridinivorans TaxID=103816 RepID=UPI001E351835|nr:hypothetical protein [Rhodococcus pyridinivorans]MCD5422664.1 hypothetical protein [Rhodococcus pyridinivorans]